jgi:hypothetical protein
VRVLRPARTTLKSAAAPLDSTMLLLHLIAGLFLAQPVPATPAPWTLAPAAIEVHAHALPAAGTLVAPAPAVSGAARGTGILQQHVPGSSSSAAGTAASDRLHGQQAAAGAASGDRRAPRRDRRVGGPLHGGRTPHSYGNPPPPPLTA